MATEIKIWEIQAKEINPTEDTSFASQHLESELENWIANTPDVLGENLLIIDRQRDIPEIGLRLDLLCIDETGQLIVVELKRDLSPRGAVAQALDYASWLNDADAEAVAANAKEYLGRDLSDAFENHFHIEMPEVQTQNHRIVLVASRLDASAERIVNYLRERYGVELNVLLFKYAKLSGGQEILVRTVLLPESVGKQSTRPSRQPTAEDLVAVARNHGTGDLVEGCRTIKDIWGEQPRSTFGGSFRYWAAREDGGFRMVFGVNVAGRLADAPDGKLDVWVRPPALSEVTGVPEKDIRAELRRGGWHVVAENSDGCSLRLSTNDEAERLVRQLKEWAKQGQDRKRS